MPSVPQGIRSGRDQAGAPGLVELTVRKRAGAEQVRRPALSPDRTELFAEYPELQPEDVRQVLELAAQNRDDLGVPREPA